MLIVRMRRRRKFMFICITRKYPYSMQSWSFISRLNQPNFFIIISPSIPTDPFIILEPQEQEISEVYAVQDRRAADFEAPKLWKGQSEPSHIFEKGFNALRSTIAVSHSCFHSEWAQHLISGFSSLFYSTAMRFFFQPCLPPFLSNQLTRIYFYVQYLKTTSQFVFFPGTALCSRWDTVSKLA